MEYMSRQGSESRQRSGQRSGQGSGQGREEGRGQGKGREANIEQYLINGEPPTFKLDTHVLQDFNSQILVSDCSPFYSPFCSPFCCKDFGWLFSLGS